MLNVYISTIPRKKTTIFTLYTYYEYSLNIVEYFPKIKKYYPYTIYLI